MNKRLVELDSLRGIAALTVVIGHFMNITPIHPTILDYTPLRILWGGHEAVILFFILSGFVLSLPFYKDGSFDYPSYVIKRFFRIYVPYIVAIFTAIIVSSINSKKDLSGLSGWIDAYWSYPISFGNIIQHTLLIIDFDTRQLNPVIWSLVQEMRISLLFPLLMFFVIRFKWKTCIGIAGSLSVISVLNRLGQFDVSIGYFTSYFDTLHYISMFIIGALLAKNYKVLISKYTSLKRVRKFLLVICGLALYTSMPIINLVFPLDLNYVLSDWMIASGVIMLIVITLGSSTISFILQKKAFVLCGELSYSIYLYHLILLITLSNILYGIVSIYVVYLLTFVGTFLVSYLSWRYIEKPSMKLGKELSKGLKGKSKKYRRTA